MPQPDSLREPPPPPQAGEGAKGTKCWSAWWGRKSPASGSSPVATKSWMNLTMQPTQKNRAGTSAGLFFRRLDVPKRIEQRQVINDLPNGARGRDGSARAWGRRLYKKAAPTPSAAYR